MLQYDFKLCISDNTPKLCHCSEIVTKSQHQSPLLMSLLIFLCYTPLFCIDLKTSSMYTKEFMAECEQYMYLILVATQGSGKGVVVLEEAGDPGGKKGD